MECEGRRDRRAPGRNVVGAPERPARSRRCKPAAMKDVAAAVAYLASACASYITGQSLVVDGGVSDHMLALIPGRPAKER